MPLTHSNRDFGDEQPPKYFCHRCAPPDTYPDTFLAYQETPTDKRPVWLETHRAVAVPYYDAEAIFLNDTEITQRVFFVFLGEDPYVVAYVDGPDNRVLTCDVCYVAAATDVLRGQIELSDVYRRKEYWFKPRHVV